jgi:hypothetical protein
MKKTIVILCTLLCINGFSQNQTSDGTYPLADFVSVVNKALFLANESISKSTAELVNAKVTLKTVYSKEGGGGFKLFISASKKWEKELSSSIVYEYVKPDKINLKMALISEAVKVQPEVVISKAIISAIQQWEATVLNINGLNKDAFTLNISFLVKQSGSAGIEVEVFGIGLEGGYNTENAISHSIELKFKTKN